MKISKSDPRSIEGARRSVLKERFKGSGYKLCPVLLDDGNPCGTPIRPEIIMTPTGRIKEKGEGIKVHLRCMCEVCFQGAGNDEMSKVKLHLKEPIKRGLET